MLRTPLLCDGPTYTPVGNTPIGGGGGGYDGVTTGVGVEGAGGAKYWALLLLNGTGVTTLGGASSS